MGQPGGNPNFAKEALGPERRSDLRAQHLDGDLAMVLEILGEKYERHPTPPQLAFDRVAVGECCLELGEEVGHARAPARGRTPSYESGQ